ncbi:MAG: helix-turn-helix transcriptional regulator [Opitutaceae bacterium]|jgi:transcriptional regulator with XRE-family HTH domain
MHYTQLFRSLREAKGLTIEGLAELAGCHRNTVTNVESGRPVKFKTIAELMEKMGYTDQSSEMKSLGLLWLESVSGIPFSQPRTETAAIKAIGTYRKSLRESAKRLEAEAVKSGLTPDRIDLLIFALRHPEMLAILENVRDLMATLNADSDLPDLKVAEDEK